MDQALRILNSHCLSLQAILNTMCGYGTQSLKAWQAESLVYTEGCLAKIVRWGQSNLLLVAGLAIGLLVLEVRSFGLRGPVWDEAPLMSELLREQDS